MWNIGEVYGIEPKLGGNLIRGAMPPPSTYSDFRVAEGVDASGVLECIYRFLDEAKRHPGTVLTESDLKCGLYKELTTHPTLSVPVATRSGAHYTASWVHTEVPWFDREGKLTIRPDITILNPGALRIVGEPAYPLPSKGCSFDGQAILVELKFARAPEGISRAVLAEIQWDYDKINGLLGRLRSQDAETHVLCIFVVVSRYAKCCEGWDALKASIEATNRCILVNFELGFPILPPVAG